MPQSDLSERAIYNTWYAMLHRCYNPSNANYRYYGGRGIRVCNRWRNSRAAFVADMGPRPEGMTLDRIDNDGDYEPGNCRWASRAEQQRNTRYTRNITRDGKTQCCSEWAREIGISLTALRQRIRLHGHKVALAMPRGKRQSPHACRRVARTSTGYKGVYPHPCGKFEAGCKFRGKKYYLGLFADPAVAARAYDAKALELFGDKAKLNFTPESQKGAA